MLLLGGRARITYHGPRYVCIVCIVWRALPCRSVWQPGATRYGTRGSLGVARGSLGVARRSQGGQVSRAQWPMASYDVWLPMASKDFQRLPGASKGFQGLPGASKGFQRLPPLRSPHRLRCSTPNPNPNPLLTGCDARPLTLTLTLSSQAAVLAELQ